MGIENDRYHANTARISNSMLSVLKRSPQEFLQTFVTQTIVNEQSSSMALGELVHSLALEPDTFSSRYAVVPKCDRRTTEGKIAWAEFQAEANGKQLVDGDLYQQACECVESLSNHDIGRYYINELPRDAVIEVPIMFDWLEVPCKCKPDMVLPESQIIIDITTTKDASPGAFCKSVGAFGYARQAAFYKLACREKYGDDFRFFFFVVNTSAPYESAVYELDDQSIAIGFDEIEQLLTEYKSRLATDEWIANWSSGVVNLSLPRWYDKHVFALEG
jgi:exodeoxyribonuclease VIII